MDIDEDDDFYGADEPEAPPAQPASAAAPAAPAAPPKADAADELEEGEEEDEGGAMDEDDDSVNIPSHQKLFLGANLSPGRRHYR